MSLKFLSIVMIATSCNAVATEVVSLPQPWRDSHYASCYPSLKAGLSDTYGVGFEEDENIVQFRRHIGSRNFVISSDTTSGTNSQRVVFEQRNERDWCVVLTSPPVADLTPGRVFASSQRPLTWSSVTQAPPGFLETKVIYTWDSKYLIYRPESCYKGRVGRWKSFDCNEAYR
ncbi:hypothetical protein GCT13_04510 [Paraburkholderia sp. CNPSo 3157]|uniref:Lipoprotein n=1 Tax=Paraburkholderia franconis TaxID=2654983 RepID=A0A7X1N6E0_9BURK|nr:hypothetical protein [Paraburkholderia franconis]MPW16207.1 hypothetical protein [Paraburkholderia franconis]